MNPYADTNFLVRLYLELPDSDDVLAFGEGREKPGGNALPITWLLRSELCNALQLYVFQRAPTYRRVTLEHAAVAWATFQEDLRKPVRLRVAAVLATELERTFEELSLRHAAKHGFRTYDLLHVASALLLECDTFWSFDVKASRLAALEGLRVRSTKSK